MLSTGARRILAALLLSLAPVISIDSPAEAATILLPVQQNVEYAIMDRDTEKAGARSGVISQAALLPFDNDPMLWSLLASGVGLMATAMRRKRRMPSVTS